MSLKQSFLNVCTETMKLFEAKELPANWGVIQTNFVGMIKQGFRTVTLGKMGVSFIL